MLIGPQGQMRLTDAASHVVNVGRIAKGELRYTEPSSGDLTKSTGGKARFARLSPSRRSEIVKTAATARWAEKEGVT